MKKSILKSILVLIALAGFVSPALAADATNGDWTVAADIDGVVITDTAGPGLNADTLKFSSNVHYVYLADTTDDGSYFGLGTWNSKGTKVYASNSSSSKIYATITEITTTDLRDGITPVASGTWASSAWSEVGK